MKEWKDRWKKGLSVFLTMAVICSGVNVPAISAFAEESVGKEQEELAVTVPVAEDELPDSDEKGRYFPGGEAGRDRVKRRLPQSRCQSSVLRQFCVIVQPVCLLLFTAWGRSK